MKRIEKLPPAQALGPCETPIDDGRPRKRHSYIWARNPHDYYVEPSWCSERLFAIEKFDGEVVDPACGSGRIVVSARAAGYQARGYDIAERPGGWPIGDFMKWRGDFEIENLVSNPPFKLAREFAERALALTTRKIALLLPAIWVQGDKRSRWLETTPLARVWFITPRPSMPPGDLVESGVRPAAGKTDFAWFVWDRGFDGLPAIGWCRRVP